MKIMKIFNVLIACEESQRVCEAFRKRGFVAFSCDIQDCSGNHPEWHIKDDALKIINGNCAFSTQDQQKFYLKGQWDLIIAHPPCTYLSNVATRSFSLKSTPAEKVVTRWEQRALAVGFFMQFITANCEHIAVENPVGFMTRAYRAPDQYINPWMFATSESDSENYHSKKTGLWLKGLPKLKPLGIIKEFNCEKVYGKYSSGKNRTWEDTQSKNRSSVRSKTFPGIAEAMAEQWGNFLKERYNKNV